MKTYFVSYLTESLSPDCNAFTQYLMINQIQNGVVELDSCEFNTKLRFDNKTGVTIPSEVKSGWELVDTIKNKLPENKYSNIKIISINQLS